MKHITLVPIIGCFTIITFSILFTFSSCRTLKQKTFEQESMIQKQYTGVQSRQAAMSEWWDSTGRYWFFSTDSAFYYHPDSGLYATQGMLSMSESNLQVHRQELLLDSIHTVTAQQESYNVWKTYYRRVTDSRWTILLVVVVLLGCGFLFKRIRRM
ncbi:hypothetical protein [Sphingobacterium tabacisoli]|uniref:Uncharacterized protein n=1 Tax=Sphingobacterium tabacisoli TaxID=2044855 RepID=A0ABW5LAW5_9SPHI|nr:hypothetical protein [Sphingobacterium tabacisoli]